MQKDPDFPKDLWDAFIKFGCEFESIYTVPELGSYMIECFALMIFFCAPSEQAARLLIEEAVGDGYGYYKFLLEQKNGLEDSFTKVGGRILIDEEKFYEGPST